MAIVRWDPFDAFLGAQDEMTRMFRRSWLRGHEEENLYEGGKWAPAVDIYETGDSLIVEAELPGIEVKDIDVTVDDGILTIKGERTHEREVDEENYHRVERAWGLFQRSIKLPAETVADSVKASYEDGVLKVMVPNTEPQKPKSIPVTVETTKEMK